MPASPNFDVYFNPEKMSGLQLKAGIHKTAAWPNREFVTEFLRVLIQGSAAAEPMAFVSDLTELRN